MRVFGLVVVCILVRTAWAQAPAPMNITMPQAPATQLQLVGPGGQRINAPPEVGLRPYTEVLAHSERVRDILRRNRLHVDGNTRQMLMLLNPEQDFSHSKLKAGTKLDMFVPKWGVDGSAALLNQKLTFNSPYVGKLAVRDQINQAAENKIAADRLSKETFESATVASDHRGAVTDIDTAAKALETNALLFSPLDFAAVNYEIGLANRHAAKVNSVALRSGVISAIEVAPVKTAATSLRKMVERMQSGTSPLPFRRITVRVVDMGTGRHAKGFQVYVLPSRMFESPEDYKDDLEGSLGRFSIMDNDDESPSTGDLPVIDVRAWIGPKLKFKEMAQLVRNRRLTKAQPINDPDPTHSSVELVFSAPRDIVRP